MEDGRVLSRCGDALAQSAATQGRRDGTACGLAAVAALPAAHPAVIRLSPSSAHRAGVREDGRIPTLTRESPRWLIPVGDDTLLRVAGVALTGVDIGRVLVVPGLRLDPFLVRQLASGRTDVGKLLEVLLARRPGQAGSGHPPAAYRLA